jgi:ABC-2 type transport system permease protein
MIGDVQTVFVAELLRRIRSRAFLVGLVMGLFALFAITRLPFLIGSAYAGAKTIVIVANPALGAAAKPLLERDYNVGAVLAPQPVTAALLRERGAAAAIALSIGKSGGLQAAIDARDPSELSVGAIRRDLLPLQFQVVMHRSASEIAAISDIPVTVRTTGSKFSSTAQAQTAQGIAYTLIFFLYVLILGNSQLVTTSVAEEKSSRIAELLVASVEPSSLLAGKVLAGAVLAIVQLGVWMLAGFVFGGGASVRAEAVGANPFSLVGIGQVISPAVLVAFLLFFIIGFLQLSTVLAAFASLVNRTEDLGSIIGPLVLSLVIALFIAMAALGAPESGWAIAASFVPLFAPFVMFARIAVSEVPVWQILASLAINMAALALIAIFAGKLYRIGMLLYGRAPKLTQILTVLRSQ